MNFIRNKDHIRVDSKGVATITKTNLKLLNIQVGDHFCLSIDLGINQIFTNRIYFLKVQRDISPIDLSKVIELKKLGGKSCFYINPLLRALDIKPLFIAELDPESGNGYDFSIVLPDERKIMLNAKVLSMLKKL